MIELYILDGDFNTLGIIDGFISLQWMRKYYEVGQFKLICISEYYSILRQGYYLYKNNTTELGIIEGIQIERNEITVVGRFAEALLYDRIIIPKMEFNTNIELCMREMVDKNAISTTPERVVHHLCLGALTGFQETIKMQTTYSNLMEKLYETGKPYEISFRIEYDFIGNKLNFVVWRGKDRTDGQTVDNPAIFSTDFENVHANIYRLDRSTLKNYAIVAGQGEGAARVVTTIDITGGGTRRELYVDARDLGQGEGQTMTSYLADLQRRGREKLAENALIETLSGEIDGSRNLIYREDFDLGDIITFQDTRLSLFLNSRLTEICEIYECGALKLDVIFGEDYKTIAYVSK